MDHIIVNKRTCATESAMLELFNRESEVIKASILSYYLYGGTVFICLYTYFFIYLSIYWLVYFHPFSPSHCYLPAYLLPTSFSCYPPFYPFLLPLLFHSLVYLQYE